MTLENWHLMMYGVTFMAVIFAILLWVTIIILFRKIDVDRMVGFTVAFAILSFGVLLLAFAYKTLS